MPVSTSLSRLGAVGGFYFALLRRWWSKTAFPSDGTCYISSNPRDTMSSLSENPLLFCALLIVFTFVECSMSQTEQLLILTVCYPALCYKAFEYKRKHCPAIL